MKPRLFIFDLDGVITDTAKYHYLAWKRLADELGFQFTEEDNERLKGVSRIRSFEIMLEINHAENNYTAQEKENLANRKNEYYKEYVETITSADLLPGVYEFITRAKTEGIRCAVASISKNAPRILDRLGIAQDFDYIADPAAVVHPKPHPEIFSVCAEALGYCAEECIGFEDAQAGIEAIDAAGMMSVGIGVTVTSISPDMPLKGTGELDFDKILKFYEER